MKDTEPAESKEILDFFDFYFSSDGHFYIKKHPNFHDKSKNKNWKINFSFVSSHSASFMKIGSKRWRGVCISLAGKGPKSA